MPILIDIKTEFVNDKMDIPEYAHLGDSGVDLQANITDETHLSFGERKLIPTGVFLGLPLTRASENHNWEVQLRPRSGLAHKKGVTIVNAPGTIDSIYTGQIFVNIINMGVEKFVIKPGDKIAQAVLTKAYKMEFVETNELTKTERGSNGHGSTDELKES